MKKNLYQILGVITIISLSVFYYISQRVSFSVVVPVYNAEKYLAKCLDSILSQSKNLEIIAVNDGSTDNSLNILQDYAKKHSNIKVITQTNQGVSSARNLGIKNATKDYITFVDSDDTLELETIKKVTKIIKKDTPDIVLTSYYDVYDKNWVEKIRGKEDAESMTSSVKYASHSLDKLSLYTPFYAKDSLNDLYYIGGGVRGRFFSQKFIKQNDIIFPNSLQCYEDDVFMIKAFSFNPKISIINDSLYNYLNRPNSISKSKETLICGKQSWEIMSSTKEYQTLTRHQKMLVKDLFISYIFLSIANFERNNLPLNAVIQEAQKVIQTFSIYNRKELKSLRNYQKLRRILLSL